MSGADIHNLFKDCLHQPGDYDCIDHKGIDAFLNNDHVREDMHVDAPQKWELCNSTLERVY